MTLPNADRAHVPLEKLTGYLLDVEHPEGGSKARLLRAHGFDESTLDFLEDGLLAIARTGSVQDERWNGHATAYAVTGDLPTPRGTTARLRTVWAVDDRQEPRFVTAYPASPPRPAPS